MRKILHGRILRRESKKQHLSIVSKSCSISICLVNPYRLYHIDKSHIAELTPLYAKVFEI